MTIDGQAGRPILDRTNYVKVGLTGIQLLEQPERLEISTAIVGVIITYLTDGIPREVAVDWELFTDQIQRVPATATDPAGPLPTFLTPDDNVHTWTNYLKNYQLPTVQEVSIAESLGQLSIPLASLLCLVLLVPAGWQVAKRARNGGLLPLPIVTAIALVVVGIVSLPYARLSIARPVAIAGVLDDQQATALLETLLENRRSFAVQAAGGAQAKVKEVNIQNASAERLDGSPLEYALRGQWTAMGTVGHWGHVHTRQNLYDAIVTIEAVDGAWKITELEVIEENRIDPSAATIATREQTQVVGSGGT